MTAQTQKAISNNNTNAISQTVSQYNSIVCMELILVNYEQSESISTCLDNDRQSSSSLDQTVEIINQDSNDDAHTKPSSLFPRSSQVRDFPGS